MKFVSNKQQAEVTAYAAEMDIDLDHLEGSSAVRSVKRTARRYAARSRILAAIRAHGTGYTSASAALRSAAERHFGSWADACRAAGLEPPKRGRPRKGLQHHITLEPLDDNGNRV